MSLKEIISRKVSSCYRKFETIMTQQDANTGPWWLNPEMLSYAALALTSTTALILIRPYEFLKTASAAFYNQAELGFWVFLCTGIRSYRQENRSQVTDSIVSLTYYLCHAFNVPRIATQTCLLSYPLEDIPTSVLSFLSYAPFIGIASNLLTRKLNNMIIDLIIKLICLGCIYMSFNEIKSPGLGALCCSLLLCSEICYYIPTKTPTALCITVFDIFYVQWLLKVHEAKF